MYSGKIFLKREKKYNRVSEVSFILYYYFILPYVYIFSLFCNSFKRKVLWLSVPLFVEGLLQEHIYSMLTMLSALSTQCGPNSFWNSFIWYRSYIQTTYFQQHICWEQKNVIENVHILVFFCIISSTLSKSTGILVFLWIQKPWVVGGRR